jgi:hypothetical protein
VILLHPFYLLKLLSHIYRCILSHCSPIGDTVESVISKLLFLAVKVNLQ